MRKIFIPLCLAAVLALAGCGGESEEGADGATNVAATNEAADQNDAPPLSKSAFIKQADKICSDAEVEINSNIQRNKTNYGMGFGAQPNKKQQEEALVDLVLPVIVEEVEEIAELGVPKGDEKEVQAIVAALERGVSETEADPSIAQSGKNPFLKAAELSQKYGLKVCGQ